jgi:hypothetical protein
MASPPPEVRPIIENRVSSPGSNYPQQQYQHHPTPSSAGGIASGAPAPASAQAAAEAAARERDERTPTAPPKRLREWEDESPMNQKPPTNDEKRQRLDEPHSRRTSPPHRIPSPPRHSPHDNMDARRLNDGYHPSEAAHHPPSLPSINATQPMPRMSETPKQERPEHHEPAARQMDVDEDYSDGAEDEKRNGPLKSERESPRTVPTNGLSHAPTPVEQKS